MRAKTLCLTRPVARVKIVTHTAIVALGLRLLRNTLFDCFRLLGFVDPLKSHLKLLKQGLAFKKKRCQELSGTIFTMFAPLLRLRSRFRRATHGPQRALQAQATCHPLHPSRFPIRLTALHAPP
jgi:hypothetical protein